MVTGMKDRALRQTCRDRPTDELSQRREKEFRVLTEDTCGVSAQNKLSISHHLSSL